MQIGVCPATTDWIDGPPARERRLSAKSSPKVSLNSSLARCGRGADAGRGERLYLPGLALSRFHQLLHRFSPGCWGLTNSALGEPAALVTGARSLSGS